MPILEPSKTVRKAIVRLSLNSEFLEEIKKYMEFAKLKKYDDFFAQAAAFIFSKDKDWQEYKKQSKV